MGTRVTLKKLALDRRMGILFSGHWHQEGGKGRKMKSNASIVKRCSRLRYFTCHYVKVRNKTEFSG